MSRFIIIREDLVQDPLTVVTDGLLIGRLLQCELLLNHPAVSRVQAGIKWVDDVYYLFSLRPGNPPKLNGRAVEETEAVAPGDLIEIGPFRLEVDRHDGTLELKVSLQIGVGLGIHDTDIPNFRTTKLLQDPADGKKPAKPRAAPLPGSKTLDFFWDKRIREAGKIVRRSVLFPRSQLRTGKAQFNWTPTSDLARRWPISFFVWAAVIVGALSASAAYWYANAYAPAPVSRSHAMDRMEMSPPIAIKANADSCTNCHSLTSSTETKCATCHNTEAFAATIIKPHVDAGVGCVICHAEHKGSDFSPAQASLATCTGCHNDANKIIYNGRRVGTPHNGTFGYPVVDERWTWEGLGSNDWALKKIEMARAPTDSDDQWRSKQFHALHVQRVRSGAGMRGNLQGELSCSSCHASFNPIDRSTPRTTCAGCHNGRIDPQSQRVLIAADKPNCTSCHVQHVKDSKHWNTSLMATAVGAK